MMEGWWWVALIGVFVLRFEHYRRERHLRALSREQRLRGWEYSRWSGLLLLLGSLAFLAWEWSRDRSLPAWQPAYPEIAFVILAPAICWSSLKQLTGNPIDREDPTAFRNPWVLVALGLGIVNAYALGVWKRVSPEVMRDPVVWTIVMIVGAVAGVLMLLESRDRARRGRAESKSHSGAP